MTLEEMKNVDIRTVNPETLRERENVRIDARKPKKERIVSFLKQIENPYCYLDGGCIVKIGFVDTKETIDDRLEAYARSRVMQS